MTSHKLKYALPVLAALLLNSCKKELIPGTYEGTAVSMGNGQAWSWVKFDKEGTTQSLGFTLTDAALENLPDSTDHPSGNDHENIFELQFPPKSVTGTNFLHCAINWNPKGHTSPVYDKPHLDVHFYMMTSAERDLIPEYADDPAKFENYPSADYFPPDYFVPGPPGGGAIAAAEPKMGTHWIDSKSKELAPPFDFTETFVYGSYDYKVNFYEPMIAYAFLRNVTSFTRDIPQPAKVQVSGYYPRKLRITHANGEYEVAMEDWYYRVAE